MLVDIYTLLVGSLIQYYIIVVVYLHREVLSMLLHILHLQQRDIHHMSRLQMVWYQISNGQQQIVGGTYTLHQSGIVSTYYAQYIPCRHHLGVTTVVVDDSSCSTSCLRPCQQFGISYHTTLVLFQRCQALVLLVLYTVMGSGILGVSLAMQYLATSVMHGIQYAMSSRGVATCQQYSSGMQYVGCTSSTTMLRVYHYIHGVSYS